MYIERVYLRCGGDYIRGFYIGGVIAEISVRYLRARGMFSVLFLLFSLTLERGRESSKRKGGEC